MVHYNPLTPPTAAIAYMCANKAAERDGMVKLPPVPKTYVQQAGVVQVAISFPASKVPRPELTDKVTFGISSSSNPASLSSLPLLLLPIINLPRY